MSKKVLLSEYNMSGHVGPYNLRNSSVIMQCDTKQDPQIAEQSQARLQYAQQYNRAPAGPLNSEPELAPISLNHGLARPLGMKHLPVEIAYPAAVCDQYGYSESCVGNSDRLDARRLARQWWLGV
jgi:hypothetical protein